MSNENKLSTYKGEFALTNAPDNRYVGLLTVADDGEALLEVFGTFDTPSPATDSNTYTIWGQAFDGKAISLLDCTRKQRKTTYGVSDVELWHVRFVLLGGTAPDRTTPYFDTAIVRIEQMREWVNLDGGEMTFNHDGSSFDYHYADPAPITFKIDNTIDGSIYFRNEFWVGQPFKNISEQHAYLHLQSQEKLSLYQILTYIRSFRQLLSFFIGYKVRIKSVVLSSPEVKAHVINPTRGYEPQAQLMELFFKDSETYNQLREPVMFYVSFKDIQPNIETIVMNWYDLTNSALSPVAAILLEAMARQDFFDESEFLRAWQGVEAFHRIVLQDTQELRREFELWFNRINDYVTDLELLKKIKDQLGHAYETSARQRLKQVIQNNAEVLKLNVEPKVIKYWIREIIDSRNYLTHLDPASQGNKASLQHLFNYTGLLRALLTVMVLRHLGVPEHLLTNIQEHPTFNLRGLRRIGS